jgi:hypothetical protein
LLVLLGIGPGGLASVVRGHAAELTSGSGALSPGDIDDLIAFGEVVVEGRALSVSERRFLLEHIEDRLRHAGEYPELYRKTVSTLQRLAGRPFARLELRERVELVSRHRLASRASMDEAVGPFAEEMQDIRKRAVEDLVGGYYGSPAGWAIVGYQTFPGSCGDLTRYTRAEP